AFVSAACAEVARGAAPLLLRAEIRSYSSRGDGSRPAIAETTRIYISARLRRASTIADWRPLLGRTQPLGVSNSSVSPCERTGFPSLELRRHFEAAVEGQCQGREAVSGEEREVVRISAPICVGIVGDDDSALAQVRRDERYGRPRERRPDVHQH